MYRVGIDIGGTKMNIGILDADNKIIISKKVYIKDCSEPYASHGDVK